MKNNIIICGDGHGIESVYDGLITSGNEFCLCTNDINLKRKAWIDGILTFNNYHDAIKGSNDIVLTSSYKPKISEFDLKKARFINIHYALLPKYRGMHALVWALLNGEESVGFTVHETTMLLDQGPIIYQEALAVKEKTSWELMLEIDCLVSEKIANILDGYISGKVLPILQNEMEAIYVAPRNIEDCKINWSEWGAVYFSRALKALVEPYPLPFFYHNETKIEIVKADIFFKNYVEINGHLVYIDTKFVYIKIPDGLLRLELIRINQEIIPAISVFYKIGIRFK